MIPVTFKIITHDMPEYWAAVSLREEVLLHKRSDLTFLPEELKKEKDSIQIVGFQNDEIIATAALVPEGNNCKMQHVSVKKCLQNSSIGSQLMEFCESQAKAHGFISIYCHADDSAVNFYLKNNYIPEGVCFDEASISYLKMRKILAFDFGTSTPEEQSFLDKSLGDFNIDKVSATQKNHLIPLNYCFKKQDVIIAGINAEMYYWHIVYVSILFVDKAYRHNNLGSYLLNKIETEAKTMGAKLVHLDTYDFQAKDFYLKHGYEIFGILEDCPKGHNRYYLKKILKINND